MLTGERPRENSTPVVPDNVNAFLSRASRDSRNVADQMLESVRFPSARLVREVVTAEIRSDDRESCVSEGRDLVPPRIPELREAVEQYYSGT